MTSQSGTYALLLRAEAEQTIAVGALGQMTVRPELYIYVGSAFGPGGLRARVRRHARGDGALHWHVDYLREITSLEVVWYTHDDERRECTWATVLRDASGARIPRDGFGASDCGCAAHLVAFGDPPSLSTFRQSVRAACPDHSPIARTDPEAMIE